MPEIDRRSRCLVAALAVLGLTATAPPATTTPAPDPPRAQQAGHATVPATGAAAPGGLHATEREPDPVLQEIEELRRLLSDTGRRYKRRKEVDKAEARRDLLAALARARTEVTAAHELVAAR